MHRIGLQQQFETNALNPLHTQLAPGITSLYHLPLFSCANICPIRSHVQPLPYLSAFTRSFGADFSLLDQGLFADRPNLALISFASTRNNYDYGSIHSPE
jgi:hypothetical protein